MGLHVAFVSPTAVTAPEVDLSKLDALVERTFGAPPTATTTTPMPGGASTRRYYRLALPDGKTAVAMYVPEGGKPEEVQKVHDGTRWPFLEVRDLLAEHGVDVPTILAEDTDRGWLLLEDLGEDTLANWLLRRPNDKGELYSMAVRDLARAQNELAVLPEGCVIASRRFDYELLRWEIEHFKEWGLDARDKPLHAEDLADWNAIADRLARRVADLPDGFVHRDYQSRNLMVVPMPSSSIRDVAKATSPSSSEVRLVWIDFQDALLGPRVYDLVALLNDSYQSFDRAFVEARLAEYGEAAGLEADARSRLPAEFDLVTVQRKLKDAGRFVFIDKQKNNPSFLKFVTPTIKKVGASLARLAPHDDDMRRLRSILERAVGDELL